MAIRRFDSKFNPQRNLNNIDRNLRLNFFTEHTSKQLSGAKIRDCFVAKLTISEIQSLNTWTRDIGKEINWIEVFKNMYGGIAKNFKILQFQYKLLLRISTCRYKRFKMNIEKTSPLCYHCSLELETLPHIYLQCKKSAEFLNSVENCIINNFQEDYQDPFKIYYITCSHENKIVNYLLAVTKMYISHCYQLQKEINWNHFRYFVSTLLVGEREPIFTNIKLALGLL